MGWDYSSIVYLATAVEVKVAYIISVEFYVDVFIYFI